ncbi:MAG TPA: long-chain fatty acid--CoA ligase [Thermoanaerobaculia bacterium]|nr:long-chain fatty acid--CoA ligase [Thermoanaerobaculia bacterium]
MLSTMQDYPLTINMMYQHGRRIYAESKIRTFEGNGCREATFAEIGDRAERLAAALHRLGVRPSDRVGTFCWNNQEHMEAYLAVPCMGAVLHTLNIRLFPEQLTYVVNHAEDKIVLVDDTLVPLLAGVLESLRTVEAFVVIGKGDATPLAATGKAVYRYEDLLAAESIGYPWPTIDERAAAAMCYTSGTTGNPKGVVYGHRSTVLHSFAAASGAVFGLNEHDRILAIVPMFHANAWGLPYVGWMVGADFVMPQRWLQAEPICRMITEERPTVTGAVPTILNDVLRFAEKNPVDFSSLRFVLCGGSAVPRVLIEAYEKRHSIQIVQGWGMTETSPLAARALPPKGTPPEEAMDWRAKTGRIVPGVELRIVDDSGKELPWDGTAVGEIQIRGPWVTASYYLDDDPEKFQEGWLRTGDVGTLDSRGFIQITDRAKDVIKSGGEWISSVDLENELMAHPDVVEAAVIGVPDDKWDERPLACVVLREEARTRPEELRAFLTDRVARWWLPSKWTYVEQIPKTSVGKFDKKVLRARYGESELTVVDLESESTRAAS